MRRACSLLVSGLLGFAASGSFTFSASAATVVPTPPGTFFVVDNGPGDQTNPHVSGNLVSYTDSATLPGVTVIRYHDIVTGVDTAVPLPTGGSTDDLSDIDGSRIVYTNTSPTTAAIDLFDTATPGVAPVELSPQAGSARNQASIGGNTVAWQDLGRSGTGLSADIVAHDLVTGTDTFLTNDTQLLNELPAVSLDGTVIVWLKCQVNLTGCNVWEATLSGSTWTTKALTSDGNDFHVDTNGSLVVYSRAGNVFVQPVGGGPEQDLTASLDGSNANPSMSGNLVAFEHTPPGTTQTDIWVIDVSSGATFQVTNTPTLSERLTAISVSPSGVVNVAWVISGTGLDVLGFSFHYGKDTTPPVVNMPGNMTVPATSTAGATVSYAVTATDPDNSASQLSITCAPIASGGLFPVGTTTVTCAAADPAGNTASAAFTVTVTYSVCAQYDQSKAVHSGATVPIKVELCDATGADISSSSVVLTATGVTQVSSSAPGVLDSPGNSNPDSNFRFDASMGTSGGYIYNLSTGGLTTGTYALAFTVSSDPNSHSVEFQVK